ncbi:MAG TPA: PAS domain S-box protein, partial [Puia sp.]|nr:PAS domain S-box protein [Puia sp.]
MKKIILYFIAGALLVVSVSFFNKAHKELISLFDLSGRATIVYSSYQNLSRQINDAAVINPELMKAGKYSNGINLFYTDSETVIRQLDLLRSTIRDSINLKITEELSKEIRQELSWLLKSNVPDSILHHKSARHIASLQKIDSLINTGIKRTNFLFEYRKKKLNGSISNLRTWMFISIMLSAILLIYTSINLFWQKSKRRKKEEELQKKELQFRNTLDSMLEGIQIHDFNWKYTYVNNTLVKYSTYLKEELLGYTLMEKYPGIEKTDLFKTLQKCMTERVAQHIETEFSFPNGTKTFFELSIQPVPEGIFILSIDISERKKTEATLQKNIKELSEYKFALDESAIVAITDQKGIIKHVNGNFCRISKFSEAELLGQDHRIINSGYHSNEFIRDLWLTIARGNIWKGELKNKAKDGSIYWVDTTIVPFLNEEGKPYQYLAIRSDITERKKAEAEIIASESKYRSVVENMHESLLLEDTEGRLLYANSEFSKIFGFEGDDLKTLTLKDYTSPASYFEIIERH